jgi:hypothetical protein
MSATFDQLVSAAEAAGAQDPRWVAQLCVTACVRHDDPIDATIESVKRNWPQAFYSPKKGKRR